MIKSVFTVLLTTLRDSGLESRGWYHFKATGNLYHMCLAGVWLEPITMSKQGLKSRWTVILVL